MCNTLILQSQSSKSLSPYIEQFATYVIDEIFAFSKDSSDILMQAIRNSLVSQTEDGYLKITKPTKDQSTNYRIDPVDAIIDGMIAPIIDRNRYEENYDETIDEWMELYK